MTQPVIEMKKCEGVVEVVENNDNNKCRRVKAFAREERGEKRERERREERLCWEIRGGLRCRYWKFLQ